MVGVSKGVPVQATLGATLTRLAPGDGVRAILLSTPADVYLCLDDDLDDGDVVPAAAHHLVPAGTVYPIPATRRRPLLAAVSGSVDVTLLGSARTDLPIIPASGSGGGGGSTVADREAHACSWVGFGHGSAEQDPADVNAPNFVVIGAQPHTFTPDYSWQQGISISNVWAHNNGSGLGSTRSFLQDQTAGGDEVTADRGVSAEVRGDATNEWEIRIPGKAEDYNASSLWTLSLRGPLFGAPIVWIEVENSVLTIYSAAFDVLDTAAIAWDGELDVRVRVQPTADGYVAFYLGETLVLRVDDDFSNGGQGLAFVAIEHSGPVGKFYAGAIIEAPLGTLDPSVTYYIHPLLPVADGTVESTPSTGDDVFAVVDEDGEAVSDADYTTLEINQQDLLQLETLPDCLVVGVSAYVRCRSTNGQAAYVDLVCELDGVIAYGSAPCIAPPNSEAFRPLVRAWLKAPDGSDWTVAKVNAARFGYRHAGAENGGSLQVSWFGVECLVSEAP